MLIPEPVWNPRVYSGRINLDMATGLFDNVNAIVLAESFSPYVAGELARLGVVMITHRNGDIGSLKRIG